jgi:hypothetical protein
MALVWQNEDIHGIIKIIFFLHLIPYILIFIFLHRHVFPLSAAAFALTRSLCVLLLPFSCLVAH